MRGQDGVSRAGLVPLLAAAHAAWLLRREWRTPAAVLRWDGLSWSLDAGQGERPCTAGIALDLDRWLLLRLVPAATARRAWSLPAWRAVAAAGQPPGRWHALRCALMQHAGTAPPLSATSATEAAG